MVRKTPLRTAFVLFVLAIGIGAGASLAASFSMRGGEARASDLLPVFSGSAALGGTPMAIPANESAGSALQTGARTFIADLGREALLFLDDPALSQEQKKQAFSRILKEDFDLPAIGRFALGTYWRSASAAQRKEYIELFESMVLDVYFSRFGEYGGQRFEVRGVRGEGERDFLVATAILSPGNPDIRVDWRVRPREDGYRIVDVIIEGVSMGMTQRSDFSSVIQRGGGSVQVLMDHLRRFQKG